MKMIKGIFQTKLVIKVTIMLLASHLGYAQQPSFTHRDFRGLDKLVGTWRTEKKNGVLYESWQKNSDDQFDGKSFKITNADTIVLERVRLAREGTRIVYAVRVDGENDGKETLFYLREIKGNDYIFEDKEHDFPQRVVYNMQSGNTLHAYIEGEIGGKSKQSEYNYIRLITKK
jgi:hypothetical protein